MKQEILRIEPASVVVVTAVVSFVLSIMGLISIAIISAIGLVYQFELDLNTAGRWSLLALPIVSVVTNSIFAFLGCHAYNLIASRFGGIVFHVNDALDRS